MKETVKQAVKESGAMTEVDVALTRLLAFRPEFGGGLSNHGPMALEALESLGAHWLVEDFVVPYIQRLEIYSGSNQPISHTSRLPPPTIGPSASLTPSAQTWPRSAEPQATSSFGSPTLCARSTDRQASPAAES